MNELRMPKDLHETAVGAQPSSCSEHQDFQIRLGSCTRIGQGTCQSGVTGIGKFSHAIKALNAMNLMPSEVNRLV